MIVTIDGPAGAGKSTAARTLAARLGFDFLSTGAMFRAVALAALRAGVAWEDQAGLASLVQRIRLEMPPGHVVLDGEDVTGLLRTPEVSAGASVVAVNAAVRSRLADLQRQFAAGRNIVCEGRDQGTVVFPNAECKFFLVASAEERLRRRIGEMHERGQAIDLETVRRIQAERDQRDSSRELAPLRQAGDAVVLDSSTMTSEQVVDRMEQEVRRRMRTA